MDILSNLAVCSEYLDRMKPFDESTTSNQEIRVEPRHCHHVLPHNSFIISAKQSESDAGSYLLTVKVDHENENFFFDHYIDHIPGMLSANIIRQSVLVVSHIFLNVGFDKKFTMSTFESEYFGFAELNVPIMVKCKVVNPEYRDGAFSSGKLIADLFQDGKRFASGNLGFRVFPKDVYQKLRYKNQEKTK